MFKFNTLDSDIEMVEKLLKHNLSKDLPYFKSLIKEWKENKKDLIPYFDETGRIQIDIPFTSDNITKTFLSDLQIDIIHKVLSKIQHSYTNTIPREKLYNSAYSNFFWFHFNYFTIKQIVANRIEENFVITKDGVDYTFLKDSKVSTILKAILKVDSQVESLDVDIMLTIYSRIIQELTLDSTLVLSVNPLDYLLVSAHTTGWKSCHNYVEGQYRAGTLSYMTDEVSVVAYTYRKIDKILYSDGYEYPRKEWRQMIYFDFTHASAIHSREYPNNNAMYNKQARRLSAKILSEYHDKEYNWTVLSYDNKKTIKNVEENNDNDDDDYEEPSENRTIPYSKYELDNDGLGYLGDEITAIVKLKNLGKKPCITFGNPFTCMSCGSKTNKDYDLSENLECNDCSNVSCCSRCDSVTREGDRYYMGDETICEDCYNRHYFTCNSCESIFHNDDDYEGYCQECFDDNFVYCINCNESARHDDAYFTDDGWYCEGCYNDNYFNCDHCGNETPNHEMVMIRAGDFCGNCSEEHTRPCLRCLEGIFDPDNVLDDHCDNCKAKIEVEAEEKEKELIGVGIDEF